jgi:hypothetical protein
MRLGTGGPLLGESTCLLPDSSRLAQPDRIAHQAEDTIGPAPMGNDLDDFRGAK